MPCHLLPCHPSPFYPMLSHPIYTITCFSCHPIPLHHPMPSMSSHPTLTIPAIPSTPCHPTPCHLTTSCHAIPYNLHCAIPSHLHHDISFHATPSHPTPLQRAEPAVKPSSSWLPLPTQLSSADLCWEPKIPPFLAADSNCTAASTLGCKGCCNASRIRPPASSPTRMGALAHVGSTAVLEEPTDAAFTHNRNEAGRRR